jgi:hypothetical protein
MKPRHIPIRTCVACRETDEKRDLMRIVRQPEGGILYDPKGKLSGRGAYLCARAECIALARKQKKLERSLKVSGVPEALFIELSARALEIQEGTANAATPSVSPVATGGKGTDSLPNEPRAVMSRNSERERV